MPCWYYEKQELRNSPSKLDGVSFETEMRYRKEGARFIIDTGSKMDLGYNTTATGVVYFHRFYMFHSFRQFPHYVTACCCLFLAGKVEETPKKCKDIIKTAKSLITEQKFLTFGDDPKEEVMTLERILLQTIKFDLQVEHPYTYLLKYAKCLKGDKTKLQKMVQMAWTFVNDSLCTTLALQWEPEIIAVALMYLAGKLSKFEVIDWVGRSPRHLRWWDMFVEDITMELLEDICHQVLDLYQNCQPPVPNSPPLAPKVKSGTAKSVSNGQEKIETPEASQARKNEVSSAPMKPPLLPPPEPQPLPPYAAMPPAYPFPPTVPVNTLLPPPPGPMPTHLSAPPPTHLSAPPPTLLNAPPPTHMSAPPPTHLNAPPPLGMYQNFPAPPHFPPIPPPNPVAPGFFPPAGAPGPGMPPPHRPPYFK